MPQIPVTGSYVGLETFKRRCGIVGTANDQAILDHLLAASRDFERQTLRRFFPVIATNDYRWPRYTPTATWSLWLEDDLLSATTITAQATGQNASPVAITHYFLEPQEHGPPYNRAEVDLSYSDVYSSGPTPQRSITVLGSWGFSNDTAVAGTLAADITTTTATTCNVSDASLIDVGDVLLIGTEALYVTGRSPLDTTATLSGNPAADVKVVTIGVSNGALVNAGETVLIDAEQMNVLSITGNNLNLPSAPTGRAVNGTVLAAHTAGTHVYAPRTLTVVRGVNGTTAATHLINDAIRRYQAPANVRRAVTAQAVAAYQQELAAYGRTIGAGDMAVEFTGKAVYNLWNAAVSEYCRERSGVI